jgi:hypothetical protein
LDWVRGRLESLIGRRYSWGGAETDEYDDLCDAEQWLIRRTSGAN